MVHVQAIISCSRCSKTISVLLPVKGDGTVRLLDVDLPDDWRVYRDKVYCCGAHVDLAEEE